MHETFEKGKRHVKEGGGGGCADVKMWEDSNRVLRTADHAHKVPSFDKDGKLMISDLNFGSSPKTKAEFDNKSKFGNIYDLSENAGGFGGGSKGPLGYPEAIKGKVGSGESHVVETHKLAESHKVKTYPLGESHLVETHPIKSKMVETHPIDSKRVQSYPLTKT